MFDLESLIELVSTSTATSEDGNHLVQMDYSKFIRSEGSLRSAQQASGYLATGEWGTAIPTCGEQECIHPDHMEEAGLALVAQHTQAVSLADLYRKAKSRGLVTARTEYAG
ncbi:MAG: hypothetical protein ACOYB3_02145 [Azonexus sp.]